MARPHGLAVSLEVQPSTSSSAVPLTSSPVTLPFRNTQLFQLVMKLLSASTDNATSQTLPVNASDFPYGDESRMVAIIVFGAVFAIVTFIGNLMVMVSFKIDKQLQTISNYFLFSLAVADIAIGMISIPLWTYYTAMQTWGIGYTMCQFWLCVDYLMSNASVLNLLLISFDRYFSVTRPLSYRPRRTTRKALIMIACTYIISVILWPPWIISWPYIEGKFTVEPGTCVVQFLETNPYVTVGTAVAAFYLPVTILIVLYSRVYWETRKRRRDFGKLQASQLRSEMNDSVRTQRSVSQKIKKKFSRRSIRRDASSNSFPKNNERGSLKKGVWGTNDSKGLNRTRSRINWLKMCSTRSHSSSEDSSEAQVMNIDDTSLSSSLYTAKRKNTSPPLSPIPANDETISTETQNENSPRSGSMRFRTRPTDRPTFDTYTVLIELKDEGSRPSVRLSNCDTATQEAISRRESRCRSRSDCNAEVAEPEVNRQTSVKDSISPAKNGRFSRVGTQISGGKDRKSEKERKKNERKQESKAAKTLSAILAAFIVTWTPYNVIVCYEAFFPHSVPDYLFTASYFLCYINSTINPLCYALCNARFRHTYRRILRCKFGAERPNISRNAYVRRQ
uniref:G_PROTEIN_RECEP_F1_2 domain-containing protein n=2 Tax=Haemonchus contortus TaxID=6289 RepID=A0A7I4YUN2_HAECO